MILLVHMIFGAAIGSVIDNVPLAIILAFLGHYFLDLFPHIEYLDGVENSIKKLKSDAWGKNILNMAKVFLDFCLGISLIFLFSNPPYFSGIFGRPIIYICALIAIVPDGLTVIHSLFPSQVLTLHHKIHGEKIHFLNNKKISNFWRITTQVLAIVISIILLKL